MKLVASMIVAEHEADRYLVPCVAHLLEFCDEVVLVPDGDHSWFEPRLMGAWGSDGDRVIAHIPPEPVQFFKHEGRARQTLLDLTLRSDPTHILAIDCDEFVVDGAQLRATLEAEEQATPRARTGARVREARTAVWSLCMMEVWSADDRGLRIRQDGGWVEHDVSIVYAPERLQGPLRMKDVPLACGRTPMAARGARTAHTGTGILHFGWANQAERAARHERYVVADGGRYHAGSHLDSIMWPDSRVRMNRWPWPAELATWKDQILSHAGVNGG